MDLRFWIRFRMLVCSVLGSSVHHYGIVLWSSGCDPNMAFIFHSYTFSPFSVARWQRTSWVWPKRFLSPMSTTPVLYKRLFELCAVFMTLIARGCNCLLCPHKTVGALDYLIVKSKYVKAKHKFLPRLFCSFYTNERHTRLLHQPHPGFE